MLLVRSSFLLCEGDGEAFGGGLGLPLGVTLSFALGSTEPGHRSFLQLFVARSVLQSIPKNRLRKPWALHKVVTGGSPPDCLSSGQRGCLSHTGCTEQAWSPSVDSHSRSLLLASLHPVRGNHHGTSYTARSLVSLLDFIGRPRLTVQVHKQ